MLSINIITRKIKEIPSLEMDKDRIVFYDKQVAVITQTEAVLQGKVLQLHICKQN